jgi:hypothetical protein
MVHIDFYRKKCTNITGVDAYTAHHFLTAHAFFFGELVYDFIYSSIWPGVKFRFKTELRNAYIYTADYFLA